VVASEVIAWSEPGRQFINKNKKERDYLSAGVIYVIIQKYLA